MDVGLWGIIGSALAAIGSVYAVMLSRKKVEAEAESVAIATSDRLLNMVRGQLSYMEGEVVKLQQQIIEYRHQLEAFTMTEHTLHARIRKLEAFITHNGLPIPE